jgi:hypothetical protein
MHLLAAFILLFIFTLPSCGGSGAKESDPPSTRNEIVTDEQRHEREAQKDYNTRRQEMDSANNADTLLRK